MIFDYVSSVAFNKTRKSLILDFKLKSLLGVFCHGDHLVTDPNLTSLKSNFDKLRAE